MKKVLVLCVSSLVGFSAVSAENNVTFNIGADAQWRFMPLKKGLGDNIVKKSYPQGAVYGSVKLDDSYGLEIGYENSISAKRKESFDVNDTSYFNGQLPIAAGASNVSHSKVSTQGFYGALVGLLPISEEYRLKLIGSIGLVRMRTKIVSSIDDVTPTITNLNVDQFKFTQTKWIPKLTVGLQHMVNDNIGIRATAGWEQTSKFKHITGLNMQTGNPSSVLYAGLKSSVNLGLGAFYNF